MTPDPANPQSWNRYAYVMNNPLNATDPLGLQSASQNDQCSPNSGTPVGDGNQRQPGKECGTGAIDGSDPHPPKVTTPPMYVYADALDAVETIKADIATFVSLVNSTWRPTSTTPTIGPANNKPSNCRYVDPLAAGIDVTFKLGPAFEAGNLDVGLSMFTKTLGKSGLGSEATVGFKGVFSIQRTSDNAWASGPLSYRNSITVFGFNKDLSSGSWTFQPAKEFKVGAQALLGIEFGWNSDKFKQTVNQNHACGF